jgi:phosphoribosylformylglycinamidine cyclo-ligase
LIGGETAQMPGFYQAGEYDVSGTIVGVVEKAALVDGQTIRPGDAVIGLASSGLHTNGYSLARKIFFEQLKLKPSSRLPELNNTIGDELLKVHVSYGPLVRQLIARFNPKSARITGRRRASADAKRFKAGKKSGWAIKGLAHITGGGFVDNIPRVLPRNCDVRIQLGSWEKPPIFRVLEERGGVSEPELYQVFNMGIGMTLIVEAAQAEAILKSILTRSQQAWIIGDIVKGTGRVRLSRERARPRVL